MLRGDAAYLARYTADDFQGIDPAGRKVSKSELFLPAGRSCPGFSLHSVNPS
jgi:hypothetical protein